MARVTIEDCLEHMDDRFRIVLAAAKRAKQLQMGSQAYVESGNDKSTVVALREIAAGHVESAPVEDIDEL